MELDSLKSLWKSSDSGQYPPKTGEELLELLGKESQHPISRMKNNLRKEMWFMTITYLIIIPFCFFFEHGNWQEIAWGYIVFFAIFAIYYYRKNNLLEHMTCNSCHIKSNLEKQVRTLEKYLFFYLYYGTALAGIFFVFCALLLYLKLHFNEPKSILWHSPAFPGWQTGLLWLGIASLLTWFTFILQRYWTNKLYLRHVQRLKDLLRQVEEA